jgi:hypothetical protein
MPTEILDRIFRLVVPDECWLASELHSPRPYPTGPAIKLWWEPRWIPGLRVICKRLKEVIDPVLLARQGVLITGSGRKYVYPDLREYIEKVERRMERCLSNEK